MCDFYHKKGYLCPIMFYRYSTNQNHCRLNPMKNKSQVALRIKVMYLLFFLFTVASVVFGTTRRNIISSNADYQGLQQSTGLAEGVNYEYSDFIFSVGLKSDYDAFNLPIVTADTTVRASARPSVIDLKIEADTKNPYANNVWSYLLNYTVIIIPIVSYCILLAMLISLALSFKRGRFFSRRNIMRVRWVAILQILYAICNSLYVWVDNHYAAILMTGSTYKVDTVFAPDYGSVILGLVILFIGEIFAIGYDLSEDQQLTI